MFLKYANAAVLEVKSSPTRAVTASLAKFGEFSEYRTDDGYIYVRVRAISSRKNRNGDGWPSEELKKSYRTFIGKPLFVDHHNSDPKRARGVVVDAALHIEDLQKTAALDPYYADAPDSHKPPTWIELLLEVDAKKFPKLAKAIVNGDIDSVSMGANVEMSRCSHCGNEAYSPEQFCKHILSKGAYFDYVDPNTGHKTSKQSYEDCHGVGFFELSFVFDPADETALVSDIKTAARRQMIAAIQKEGGPWGDGPDDPYRTMGFGNSDPDDPDYGDYGSPEGDYVNQGANEMEQIFRWRVQQFERIGYPPEVAEEMAANELDYHDYENLINRGATGDQAQRILSPIAKLAEYKYVKKRGDKWVITQKDTGKVLSEHDSEEDAKAAFRAMEMHMHGSNDFGDFIVTADQNPPPQSEMTMAPQKVNTLRQEQVCPVCGSAMSDGLCEVCNYEEAPEGFDNPDLNKAKEVDEEMKQQQAQEAADAPQGAQQGAQGSPPPPGAMPGSQPGAGSNTLSSTGNNFTASTLSSERTAANQGRVNTQERPILPVTRQLTDKPISPKTVSKGQKIESNRKDNNDMTDTIKTADGATPNGSGVSAENRVDVLGVGGVSGDPLSGIDHENVEKDTGDFVAPHTDTWSGGEGDSLGQQDAVTSEVFEGAPGKGNAVGVSSPPPHNSKYQVLADSSGDLGGPIGEAVGEGSASSGGSTWDSSSSGFPDHDPSRVDLLAPLKEEVGAGTETDSNEQFRSLKHTDPVTKDNANEVGGPIGTAVAKAKAIYAKAFKVAEAEVALGLADPSKKFERVAELENMAEETLDGQLETLSRVKTAGLSRPKTASAKPGVGRMPQFAKSASFDIEAHAVADDFADSLTFGS